MKLIEFNLYSDLFDIIFKGWKRKFNNKIVEFNEKSNVKTKVELNDKLDDIYYLYKLIDVNNFYSSNMPIIADCWTDLECNLHVNAILHDKMYNFGLNIIKDHFKLQLKDIKNIQHIYLLLDMKEKKLNDILFI